MNKYYIICLDDMVCYDSKETKLQADLRVLELIQENPGNAYEVKTAKISPEIMVKIKQPDVFVIKDLECQQAAP